MDKDKQLLKNGKKMLPGSGLSYHRFKKPDYRILQIFNNPSSDNYEIIFETEEVTALCPLTSQPDYYTIRITYQPFSTCIESKSAKLYFGAYRSYRGFIEKIADKIYKDWNKALHHCNYLKIELIMKPRGGITMKVTKEQS